MDETIVAISTPPGEGGVGMVRLSGPDSIRIGCILFRSHTPLGKRIRHVEYGRIYAAGREIDTGLAWVLESAHSYTGEDTVEISCHGSSLILEMVVNAAITEGAILATPGEFTRRAFLNGNLDLLQAEAVIDLIQANNESGLEDAYGLAGGRLSKDVRQLKDGLVRALARIEVGLDFSEEDIDFASRQGISERLQATLDHALSLYNTFEAGRRRQQGYLIALAGQPNVGKSTLLNCLLGEDRAIVTDIPGTTRDLVEGKTIWAGKSIRIVDTAGMRESDDPIESEGIKRARKIVSEADLVMVVVDTSTGYRDIDSWISDIVDIGRCLLVQNKIDLSGYETRPHFQTSYKSVVEISALTSYGRENLIKKALDSLPVDLAADGVVLTRQRHYECMRCMIGSTQDALRLLASGEPDECIAAELQTALLSLGQLLGESVDDDVLNSIFSEFCIGK
ncbi:MAG: tRNA uridine-5-carboxymethylaminomethyl(34) synthesis GTPase MnmE [Candidatus Latescibacterota bacterium]|jgi:tRNA modification GTPase